MTPATPGRERPPVERPVVPLGPLTFTAILGVVGVVGAWASRSLPGWDDGRWWMVTVGMEAVAMTAGVITVVLGVSALGEVNRHRLTMRGTGRAALGLAFGCAVLIVGGIQGVQDWDELDVPAAWERVDVSGGGGPTLADIADGARRATTSSDGTLRTEGRIGGCYQGTARTPGAEVVCDEPHTLVLVDRLVLADDVGDELDDRREAGAEGCMELVADVLDGEVAGGTSVAVVPDELEWVAGDRNTGCLIEFDEPVRGSLPG